MAPTKDDIKTNVRGHKGKGGHTPVEDPNSLRSNATARVVDLISEGPIVGLVGGEEGIYFDRTPVKNTDGTKNFEGVTVHTRLGDPSQEHIPGFDATETEVPFNSEITKAQPITRQINEAAASAVRIHIRLPQLVRYKDNGDIKGSKVELGVSVKTNTGDYVTHDVVFDGKTNSPYERSIRVELIPGGAPWTIKIERYTDDSTSSKLINATFWNGYTLLTDAKLSYPDTALVGLEVDAKQFGARIPERTYRVRGMITDVPSNYDPEARTYAGIWDGTFKQAWHSNPAWVLYSLMSNKRYGLGDLIPETSVDKWSLYSIGRYCDELVPDGKGGQEPRFTFNGVIRSVDDAVKVLDNIASVFRGMIYWGAGSVMVSQDAPSTPAKLVSPANVIDGEFNYTGTPLTSRSSSVAVSWNNPDDLGKPSVLIVQNDELIQKFGDRRRDVAAMGCTSRGQAKRVAEWILYTEAYESEVVSYTAAMDHADLRPGQIISVADPAYAGARFGGRIVSSNMDGTFVLDAPVVLQTGSTYILSVTLPSGVIKNYSIASGAGETNIVSTSDPITSEAELPQPEAMWVITATEAEPRKFRVLTNTEKAPNKFEISAILHFDQKYDYVDRDVRFDVPTTSVLDDTLALPPAFVTATMQRRPRRGSESQFVVLADWPASTSAATKGYSVWITEPDVAERYVGETRGTSIEIPSTHNTPGEYSVKVRSVSYDNTESSPVIASVSTAALPTELPVPTGWVGESGFDSITLRGDESPLEDFRRFNIYGATDASSALTKVGDTSSTFFVRRPPKDDIYTRYSITQEDYSGNESPAFGFIDVVPLTDITIGDPVVPTGIELTSSIQPDQTALLHATWGGASNPGDTYELMLALNGGNEVQYSTRETRHEWTVRPGASVTLRARSRNVFGRVSGYSATVTHVVASDTTPPAVPQNVTATAGFNTIWMEWDRVTDADLSHYEVYPKASATVPGVNPTGTLYDTASTTFVHSGLPDAYQRFYFVRAVDTSGNKSGWSAMAQATTSDPALTGVTTDDIQGAVDSTSFAAGLTAVEIVGVLPATGNFEGRQAVLTTNGKMYRYHGGQWTAAVAAPDITGEITSAQIENLDAGKLAGQLTDAQISAVNASKIAGTISNSQIGSLSATKIFGKLTKNQINTITTGQLEGTIGADLLAANIITAKHMAIGDFTNLNLDPLFSDAAAWGGNMFTTRGVSQPNLWGADTVAVLEGDATEWTVVIGKAFPIDGAGEAFHLRYAGRVAAGNGDCFVDIQYADNPNFTGTVSVNYAFRNIGTITASGVTEMSGTLDVPAGFPYGRLRIIKGNNGTTTAEIGGVILRRMNGGELLIDGAIAANHLAVDSVTASAIKAGEIGANHLAANSILAKHLVVGDLTNAAAGSSGLWDKHPWIMHNVGSDGVKYTAGHDGAGENAFWMYGDTTKTRATLGTVLPVTPGEQFYVSMWVYIQNTFNGDGNSKLRFGDQDGVIVYSLAYDDVTPQGWRFLETSFTVPAGVRELGVTIDNTASTGYAVVDDIVIRRKAGGELIVDGAIKADHILAGEIGTDHLAANSITAAKLAIGDFTNMIPDSAAPDVASWDNHSDVSFVSDTAADTPGSIKYDPSDGNRYAHPDKMFPVTPGEQYYVRALARVTAGDAVELRFVPRFYDRDGGQISTPVHTKLVTSATYTQIDASFTVPAGTHEMLMDFGRTGGSGTGPAHVSSPYLQRRNTGELIVDGAIKGTHLDVTSASAAILTAGAIKAGMLDAGAVTAKTLAVGDFDNLNRDMHYAEESLWQGAAGFYDTAVPDWGGKRVMRITGAGTDFNVVYGPAFTVSPEGEELWIRARMQRWAGTNNGESDIIVPVQVSDDETFNSGVVDVFPSPVVGTNSAEITSEESVITIPPGYRFCRLRPYKRNTGATEVRVGGIEVRRRNAGQLIVDGGIKANHVSTNEIITNSANIKDAVITDAKIADLDAAKLTAGSALAGSITVDGRAVASLANTDVLFDDMSVLWQHFNGSGTLGFTTTGVTTGQKNQYVSDDGVGWIEGNEKIPYDPSKLYRVTFRVRRGAGTGGGTCYLGLVGYKADKSTRVNIHGDDTAASSHYIVAKAKEQNDMPSVLTEYVGYIKGHASSGTSSDSSTIDQPCVAHEDVRYFSPIGVFNFTLSSGGYEMHIDSVKIEAIAEENVAALVNTGSTKIEPGKIVISGDTTLDDWRAVGKTTIDGGNIEADSITAASLSIGLRGVVFEGITFEADPDTDTLTWSAGRIRYRDNDNTFANVATSAGSVPWTGGVQFVWWEQGATDLTTGKNTGPLATSDGTVLLALYRGGTDLSTNIGRTVIDGDFIRTGSIEAQHIKSGELTTELLEVNGYLDMDADNTGVRIGKQSVVDSTDGAYFGRTDIAGSSGFGFYIGRTSGGTEQRIRMTEQDGLEIKNADFLLGSSTASRTTYTTSTTYTIPAGTEKIDFAFVGGGGGGQGGGVEGGVGSPGYNGGDTVVTLKDGANTIATWTAAGGQGGPGPESRTTAYSPYGNGGEGGNGAQGNSDTAPGRDGADGDGGSVATVAGFDVSGLSNPKLEINIGSGGTGGGNGDDGNAGFAEVTVYGTGTFPAGPVARQQAAAGVVSLTSGQNVLFPALGSPGFWQCWGAPSGTTIEIDSDGGTTRLHDGNGGFFSERNRPRVLSASSGTINYRFWPMG